MKTQSSITTRGLTDVNGATRLFATKCKELYRSTAYDKAEMEMTVDDVTDLPSSFSTRRDVIFSKTIYMSRSDESKTGKLWSYRQQFVNEHDDGATRLACSLTSIVIHGVEKLTFLYSSAILKPHRILRLLERPANFAFQSWRRLLCGTTIFLSSCVRWR